MDIRLGKTAKKNHQKYYSGSKCLQSKNLVSRNKYDSIACMHIRRTDHPGKSDFDFSTAGLKFLLEKEV